MTATWSQALGLAAGLVLALEILYLVLRKRVPGFSLRLLYHLWAVNLGGLLVLSQLGEQYPRLWQVAAASAVLLSALVLFAVLDGLILQRPWNSEAGPLVPKLARDVLRLVLFLAVGLYAAAVILNQPIGALLVSSTVVSAVIGLALQDTLKNIFSGMALDLEKPFKPGDWLLIDGQTRARVIDMSWRSTHLRTKEGLDIYEPNANLSVSRVVNYGSGERPVAIELRLGLPYGVPPAEIKEVLREAAQSAPGTLDRPPVRVFLESFDDHAITYFIRVWTRRVANLARFRDGIQSRIWYQLKRRNIEIPFPIRTVHMHAAPDMEEHRQSKAVRKAFELFDQIDIFEVLADEVVRDLAAASERRLFDAGEVLVSEGDEGDSLFVIERGSVGVSKSDPEGAARSIDLAVLEEGDFFGEMSLLTGEPRSATVVAREHCGVLSLGKGALASILEADPRIAEVLSRALAARRQDTTDTLEDRRGQAVSATLQQDEHTFLRRIQAFFSLT